MFVMYFLVLFVLLLRHSYQEAQLVLEFSCLKLPSSEIMDLCHHAWYLS